jgi:hypothetical protein
MTTRHPIVFDIESGPSPDAAEFAPEFEAPANYKDPAKIAAYKIDKLQEWVEQAALSAVTGRVLAIGIRENGSTLILCDDDEAAMLAEFWAYVAPDGKIRAPLVGFNSNRFDIPFLVRRSWRNRVQVPAGIVNGRYLSNAFIDLMQLWQVGDYQATVKLDVLARWLGVGAKTGSGAHFAQLLAEDRAAALESLGNDIETTEKFAIALGAIDAPVAAAAATGGDY